MTTSDARKRHAENRPTPEPDRDEWRDTDQIVTYPTESQSRLTRDGGEKR